MYKFFPPDFRIADFHVKQRNYEGDSSNNTKYKPPVFISVSK